MTLKLVLVVIVLIAGYYWWRALERRPKVSLDEARLLLDVQSDATAEDVRAAHRRIIARVHPDAGGSPELARRINAARDLLLKQPGRS